MRLLVITCKTPEGKKVYGPFPNTDFPNARYEFLNQFGNVEVTELNPTRIDKRYPVKLGPHGYIGYCKNCGTETYYNHPDCNCHDPFITEWTPSVDEINTMAVEAALLDKLEK